jgi:REP element-mobilizing transposase RayT
MTRPRKALISLADSRYYHITSRCVRRAFLYGVDHYSGQDYENRRQWVVDRIRLLSSIFGIDVCACAIMSNHYHLVLKLCPEQLDGLSDEQIMDGWCALFNGPLLIQNYRNGEALSSAERSTVSDIVNVWRTKLGSISWFMRCLNQPIARQANLEDMCTGKFWESRFTSQALKTEEALLSCMTYVDLNPIRAGMATSPETSDYTSIQERIQPMFQLDRAIDSQQSSGDLLDFTNPLKPLLPFEGGLQDETQPGILFAYGDYLQLVDWTGRIIRKDKNGHIDEKLPPILTRLQIDPNQWLLDTTQFELLHSRRFNRLKPNIDTG